MVGSLQIVKISISEDVDNVQLFIHRSRKASTYFDILAQQGPSSLIIKPLHFRHPHLSGVTKSVLPQTECSPVRLSVCAGLASTRS
jgi:hypothetical protein